MKNSFEELNELAKKLIVVIIESEEEKKKKDGTKVSRP